MRDRGDEERRGGVSALDVRRATLIFKTGEWAPTGD